MRGQELIEKYIHSGLSDEERFELEKIALDDDFVADAWEGLHDISQAEVQQSLANLTKKIAQKKDKSKKEARVIPMFRKVAKYAAAAAVLFLAVLFFRPKADIAASKTETIVVADEVTKEGHIGVTGLTVQAESVDQNIVDESVETKEEVVAPSEFYGQSIQHETEEKEAKGRNVKTEKSHPAEGADDRSASKDEEDLQENTPQHAKPALAIDLQRNANEEKALKAVDQEKINKQANPQTITETSKGIEEAEEPKALGYAITLNQEGSIEEEAKEIESRKKEITLVKKNSNVVADDIILAKKAPPTGYVDAQSPQPIVGFENYKIQLQKNNTITKEDLFMHGIKKGYLLEVKFTVDEGGKPKDINVKNLQSALIVEKVKKQFQNSGPWINVGERPVLYFLELVATD